MKSKFRYDLEALVNYVLSGGAERWDFLDSLRDNGSPALSEEELERLLDDKHDAHQLFARAWQHPEESHAYALARRLEVALVKHEDRLDAIPE